LFIVLGGNPTSENPVLGWQMKRRIKLGTPAIVINSGEIDLTAYATVWADARRGTATTLLNGIIAELARRNKLDQVFIRDRTVGIYQILGSLAKYDLGEVSAVTGVDIGKIYKIVDLLADPNKKIVAYYNLETRIDRSTNDLKALATLMLGLGKIGSEGSGIALVSNQCNTAGMQLAGFDNQLLPGGSRIDNVRHLQATSELWKTDLKHVLETSGTNLRRKIREDKIRGAVIFGENPSVAPEFHHFVNNLEFLVVADMYLTETAQAAEVFLPLSAYMETEGHLTNWFGMQQKMNPIGSPASGLRTLDVINRLSEVLGDAGSSSYDQINSELQSLAHLGRTPSRINGWFPTEDGKAHFVLYAEQTASMSADAPQVLDVDSRMAAQMKLIRT
jgi:predicted molibdopterin-dependent oxidoreductase YjgC